MSAMSGELGGEAANAVDLWTRRVAESRSSAAFKYKADGSWRTYTWTEADAAAREIAAGLAAIGVMPGDRVCILSQTRVEWMLCDVAILLCGGVAVPIYASNTPEQCAFIVKDSGACVVIVEDAAQLEKMLSVRDGFSPPIHLVHIQGDAALEKADVRGRTVVPLADVRVARDARVASLSELRASGQTWQSANAGALAQRVNAIDSQALFTIIYTSGTTGVPKGAELSHRNLTSAVASACRAMTLFQSDEQLLFLPMAHVLGQELAWVAVQAGLVTWFAESIGKLKDNLLEVRPTYMAAVPRVFEKLYAGVQGALREGSSFRRKLIAWALDVAKRTTAAATAPNGTGRGAPQLGFSLRIERALADKLVFSKLRAKLGLDRCRFLVSGAAPLSGEIAGFFYGTGILILEGYGLTETMAAAFLNRLNHFRFGTVGPALDVVEMNIADDGEILMRGPSVFRQYHNNPVATAEAVDPEGWFHSGDIGLMEDGCLRITDRKKDLIVTAGGKKVAPQPIENTLKDRSPYISQAVVYGEGRPYCVALLTPSEAAIKRFGGADGSGAATSQELRAEIEKAIASVNAGLAPYESIKKFAILASEFTEAAGEMTPSLKVKRKVVIEKYRDVIVSLYKNGRDVPAPG
jgi:long-chain acyl-CoA synthetase